MIDVEKLHKLLRLDQETGFLYWRGSPSPVIVAGGLAGNTDREGYRIIRINRKAYKAHRIIFAMTHGHWPVLQIDHINGKTGDNRPCNLREVTASQNQINTSIRPWNKSGYRGVSWSKQNGRWKVSLRLCGKEIYCGYYDDLELAALVASEAIRVNFGEFARAS